MSITGPSYLCGGRTPGPPLLSGSVVRILPQAQVWMHPPPIYFSQTCMLRMTAGHPFKATWGRIEAACGNRVHACRCRHGKADRTLCLSPGMKRAVLSPEEAYGTKPGVSRQRHQWFLAPVRNIAVSHSDQGWLRVPCAWCSL